VGGRYGGSGIMGHREVTRRQLLAGLAGAGGIGATIGTGTAAMVSDRVTFQDATIRSGTVDLSVAWATGGSNGSSGGTVEVPVELTADEPEQTVDLTVSLPDPDGKANPAYAWVRSTCPSGDDVADDLEVALRYPNCQTNCLLFDGTVSEFTSGVPLDADADATRPPGSQRCLEPGQGLDLELDLELDDEGQGAAEFTLEFVGRQCRSTDGTDRPFPTTNCEGESRHSHAISNLTLCTSAGDSIAADPASVLTTVSENEDGEPLVVDWETAVAIDFVVVKAGTVFTIYDFRGQATSQGTASPEDPDAALPAIEAAQHTASAPCDLAARELGADGYQASASQTFGFREGWEVDR